MPKIRFLREEQYECDGRGKGPVFSEGETVLASEDFALRWTRRLAAEVVGEGEPKGDASFERVKPKAEKAGKAEKASDPEPRPPAPAADQPAPGSASEGGPGPTSAAEQPAPDGGSEGGPGPAELDLGAST